MRYATSVTTMYIYAGRICKYIPTHTHYNTQQGVFISGGNMVMARRQKSTQCPGIRVPILPSLVAPTFVGVHNELLVARMTRPRIF